MLFGVEWSLLNEAIVEGFLLIVFELNIILFCLVSKHYRLSLQIKHVFILLGLAQGGRFGLKFAFIRCLSERTNHILVFCILLYCLRWPYFAFVLQILNKLFPPFKRRILLSSFHVISVRVREVIEAICFVVFSLKLVMHAFLSHTLHDVLSMLLLHRIFLLNFNLIKLINLVTNTGIFMTLLLKIVNPLLSLCLSFSLSLLHVLLHVFSGVLIWSFVKEECTLASVHFL